MNTSKAIAGISYNTPSFLQGKLEEWKSSGLIEFGAFIYHLAEEGEKKDHLHVFVLPAKRLQTLDLENDSFEFDRLHPDKPLKIVGLTLSKESEWILYTLHDPDYLKEKGLQRIHHYSLEDFITTDQDLFDIMVSRISDERKGKVEYRVIQMIKSGMTWEQMVTSGLIPMRYIYSAKIMYDSISST